ncbi:MAG: PKD domain-containing protein [Bacteroidia bacterium]
MPTIRIAILILLFPFVSHGQTIIWSEDFNNGCTDNCNADTYTGINGSWSVVDVTPPGAFANQWFVSCSENGEAVGSCGASCGNNATLHVGSVPCSICITCPTGDCGAAYNAGPSSISGEDPTTNKRAISPLISTVGKTNISLHFKYIELGQNSLDDAIIEFSIDGGASWLGFTNTPKTPFTCQPQGLWTSFSSILPNICENIPNFRLAIRWMNNDDGIGNDPSFAIDDIELSVPSTTQPVAVFTSSVPSNSCDTACVSLSDASTGNPSTWTWSSPNAINSPQVSSSPAPLCFVSSGTFPITLTVSNSNGSNSVTNNIAVTVTSRPHVQFSTTDSVLCQGDCISFNNQSTGTVSSQMWNFPGGSPSTSNASTPPSICYSTSGNYSVTLSSSNGICSASATRTNYITVNSPSTPTISVNGNILSSSTAQSYQWYSVQNGLIPGATQVSYTVTQPGDYYVVTTDMNGCQGQSGVSHVAGPTASISVVSNSTACDTSCVQLSDNSTGNPSQWSWSCPAAINPSQTGSTPAPFCFTASGTYTVTLTVSNGIGSSSTSQQIQVNVLPRPTVAFSASDTALCEGECISFLNQTSGSISSSDWSFQGGNPGSSSNNNPSSVCYANDGNYSVTLTVNNGSCSSSRTITSYIEVHTPIVPTITVNGNQLTSSAAQSYQWYSVQNGLIPGATQSTFTASSGADYYVVTTDSNGCSATSTTVNLSGPVANFNINGLSEGCDTSCVSVSDLSQGSPIQWSWSCPGAVNALQSGSSPDPFCFVEPGNYPVTLIVNNGAGSDTLEQTLAVTMLPSPEVLFTSVDSLLCTGECTSFSNLTAGTISSLSWFFSGGSPATDTTATPSNICYASSGTFPVTLTVNNGTCMKTRSIVNYIQVQSAAIPVVSQVGNTLTSTPAVTYQWFNVQSGIIAGADSSSYTVLSSGDYYVQVTDANGCTAESSPLHVDVSGIEDLLFQHYGISPNPFVNTINIHKMKIGSGTWNVSVYSIAGNLIYTRNIINTQDIQLELHDFAEGMYCLKINDESAQYAYKIIKLAQ